MGGNQFDQNGNFDFRSLADCLSLDLIVVKVKLASTAARMYHKIIASSNQPQVLRAALSGYPLEKHPLI